MIDSDLSDEIIMGAKFARADRYVDKFKKLYDEMMTKYEKEKEPVIRVVTTKDLRTLLDAIQKHITPFFNANVLDVRAINNFSFVLPTGFQGRIDGWDPADVKTIKGLGINLKTGVDFYKLAKKTLRYAPTGSDTSPARSAMPAMGIDNMHMLRRYTTAYELVDQLSSGKPVTYDQIYNRLDNVKRFYGKSPFITSGLNKTLTTNEKFTRKWGRKLLNCK